MTSSHLLTTLALAVFVTPMIAAQQPSPDEAAVRKAIENHYFKAQETGNPDDLRGYFIEEGRMMWVEDGKLRMRTSTEYISGFNGKPPADEDKRKRRIVMTDVTGDVAVAKVELDFPGVFFTDYFTLARLDGEWRIIHKSFHRRKQ